MKIAEIFYSIQGEGRLTGVPSVFIRTSGCNLRCHWCDSPYTSWHPEGESMTADAVLTRVAEFPGRHVVLTGGEPLIAAGLDDLCQALRESGYHITLETAATVFQPVACDLASLSPKLANSTPFHRDEGRFAARHNQLRRQPDVIRAFMAHSDYQLKFVIDRPTDLAEVQELLDDLGGVDRTKVLLMPQGITAEEVDQRGRWLVRECLKHGFRYCPRAHINLFGNVRGT